MNTLKRMALLLFAIMAITTGLVVQGGNAAAEKVEIPPAPTKGVPSKDITYGVGKVERNIGIDSTEYLMRSQSSIAIDSSNQITVSGNTRAYSSVSTIGVDLYLQRWNESRQEWTDIGYIGEFKDINSSIVTGSKKVNATRGYYYRTRGYHWVNQGGLVESDNTFSTYIYLN